MSAANGRLVFLLWLASSSADKRTKILLPNGQLTTAELNSRDAEHSGNVIDRAEAR
jgi:hypothetical protein